MQFAKEKCDCECCDGKFWGTAEGVAAIATWTSVQVAQNSKEKPFFFFPLACKIFEVEKFGWT